MLPNENEKMEIFYDAHVPTNPCPPFVDQIHAEELNEP